MKNLYFLFIILISCSYEKENSDLQYNSLSSSTIHVSLINNLPDTINIHAWVNTNIPRDANGSKKISIAQRGDYYLNIELDRPARSFFKVGNQSYNVFTFPNDTTHININNTGDNIEISFFGKGKEINNYYAKKKEIIGYTDNRMPMNQAITSRATYNSIKKATDSILKEEFDFFNKYTTTNRLPEWFIDYESAEIIYGGAGFKTDLPLYNKTFEIFKDKLPEDYYDFLNSIEVNNPSAILVSNYYWFLDGYFLKDLPMHKYDSLTGFSRLLKTSEYAYEQSKNQLTGIVRELYSKYRFSFFVRYCTNPSVIDSLAKEFQVRDYKKFIKLPNQNIGDTIPNFVLINEFGKKISIRKFQDRIIYVNFWATWCKPCIKNIPELNKLIDHYDGNQNIEFLNICLDTNKEKWLAIVQKHNLKGANFIASKEWNSIIKTYFNIPSIPHYVLIKEGNILYENRTYKAPHIQNKIDALIEVTSHNNI